MSIPANETWLSNLGWTNGTLDQEAQLNLAPWKEWSPAGNPSQPMNLTILPDNIATLQFLVWEYQTHHDLQSFPAKFALARTVLSSSYYSATLPCIYPISGSYDFLTRLLFYLLLLFALLYRRHSWLALAALGTAMTYSATTAVHALALLSQFGWKTGPSDAQSSKKYGDLDIYGVYPILLAAFVLVTPILNWSTNVRRDKAHFIMVLWGLLCFVALVPVTVYISSNPNGSPLHPWSANAIGGLILCPRGIVDTKPACGAVQNYTLETYNDCECTHFCGVVSPAAPMRKGATMVPFLQSQKYLNSLTSKTYVFIDYYGEALAAAIVCYGAIGLLHSHFNLREMRDLIFRGLYTVLQPAKFKAIWNMVRKKNAPSSGVRFTIDDAKPRSHQIRFVVAKTVAASYYLLGATITLICPFIFVTVIVVVEYGMMNNAYSEGSDAVGAWSTWVGASFVVIVAIVLKVQDFWERNVLDFGKWLIRVCGFDAFQTNTQGTHDHTFGRLIKSVSNFFGHVYHCSLDGARITLKLAFQEFGGWITAPRPHTLICGCGDCVAYRNLIRTSPEIVEHADKCTCDACTAFENELKNLSKGHGIQCGCKLCSWQRQQAHWERRRKSAKPCTHFEKKEKEKKFEERGYQTIWMRIFRGLDDHIISMLVEFDNPPPKATAATPAMVQVNSSTDTSTITTSPHSPNSASPRSSTQSLQSRASTVSRPHTASSVRSAVP